MLAHIIGSRLLFVTIVSTSSLACGGDIEFGLCVDPPATPDMLWIVDADRDVDFAPLWHETVVDTTSLPENWSLRADVAGLPDEVCFRVNGITALCEMEIPFSIAGDITGDYFSWNKSPGSYAIDVYADGVFRFCTFFTVL